MSILAVDRKYERDIDLLLAEEFAVNADFSAWFLRQTRFSSRSADVVDVFVSRADVLGESDLIVLFQDDQGRFALLIEDKVDAPLQPQQALRYRQRGDRELEAGFCADYATVLCAPRYYIDSRTDLDGFDHLISLEEIAARLRQDGGTRASYRAAFLESSSTKRLNTWTRRPDQATDDFWQAAYELALAEFPRLEMKPLKMTKGSTWITIRPDDMPTMPKRIYVSLKGDRGQVDLTFSSTLAPEFHARAFGLLEDGMSIQKTAASTAVRLTAQGFQTDEPLEIGLPKVRAQFAAADRLIQFYRKNRAELDAAAAAATPAAPPLAN